VESLIGAGYNVSVRFDDSIIQDKDAEINQGVMLVGAALMSKKKFMVDVLGYTPEDAEKELEQIKAEGAGASVDVTKLFSGME
jgi:hypothetical protein